MELSDAWTPDITMEEIEANGTLIDDKYDNGLYRHQEDKVLCKLYYLESRDLFALVTDSGHFSVVSSQYTVENLRHKYFKEEFKPINDAFAVNDDAEYTGFQSDLNLNDIESIKTHGRFLLSNNSEIINYDVYYIEFLDKFVVYDVSLNSGYFVTGNEYRKEFGIPYQDERMQNI
jgi:hypothetical protein